MLTIWEANSVSSSSSNPCSTLKDVLADLDITPLTPEWVAEHKHIKLLETLPVVCAAPRIPNYRTHAPQFLPLTEDEAGRASLESFGREA